MACHYPRFTFGQKEPCPGPPYTPDFTWRGHRTPPRHHLLQEAFPHSPRCGGHSLESPRLLPPPQAGDSSGEAPWVTVLRLNLSSASHGSWGTPLQASTPCAGEELQAPPPRWGWGSEETPGTWQVPVHVTFVVTTNYYSSYVPHCNQFTAQPMKWALPKPVKV